MGLVRTGWHGLIEEMNCIPCKQPVEGQSIEWLCLKSRRTTFTLCRLLSYTASITSSTFLANRCPRHRPDMPDLMKTTTFAIPRPFPLIPGVSTHAQQVFGGFPRFEIHHFSHPFSVLFLTISTLLALSSLIKTQDTVRIFRT